MVRNLLGGVAAKVSIALLGLGGTTAAAIGIGYVVFDKMETQLALFTDAHVPALEAVSDVGTQTTALRNAQEHLLIAGDRETLNAALADAETALKLLEEEITYLPAEQQQDLLAIEKSLLGELTELAEVRATEIETDSGLGIALAEVQALGVEAAGKLAEMGDSAYFDLVLGGETTTGAVSDTLHTLVDDVTALRTALEIRAATSFLSGLALSLVETNDPGVVAILTDLAASNLNRLTDAVPELAAEELFAPYVPAVEAAAAYYTDLLSRPVPRSAATRTRILDVQREAEAALMSAIDDVGFELEITVLDADETNNAAIAELLETQVGAIRRVAAIDAAVKQLLLIALEGTQVDDREALVRYQATLDSAEATLLEEAAEAQLSEDAQALVARIVEIADPVTGVLAKRGLVLEAREGSGQLTERVAQQVQAIAAEAADVSRSAQEQIALAATDLRESAVKASGLMLAVAAVGALICLLAPIGIWLTVVRPLGRVTQTTERLAAGDLAPVEGFDRARGEIGRMASALRIFRDGLIEKIRLDEETKRVEAERRAEAEAAEAKARAEEEAQRQREAEQERREREAKEAEEAQLAQLREAAEAERQARLDEQNRVVRILADSLKRLSEGDLSTRIEADMGEGYVQLRDDFNVAASTLEEVIAGIARSAEHIFGSASEITNAADDLSRRTETSAATLEETAAALNELTAAVTSAAQGAGKADRIVSDAKTSAQQSGTVVREAVGAMGEIETSSKQISRIVDVIEDIAFQTNLLALNAGVEAARAGDAGRGFAVVASEVRALAQRSSEAAREITGLISASGSQITKGVDLVGRAGAALEEIAASVSGISTHVSDIAASAREQSTGIAEINTAMGQLDQATQQNAAMFEETTAASRTLTEEASTLFELVGRFKIRGLDTSDLGEMRRAS